jgi:hypothetical protein
MKAPLRNQRNRNQQSVRNQQSAIAYPSMISKLETISAVGLNVAATLQYFCSESSIACATDRFEMLRL